MRLCLETGTHDAHYENMCHVGSLEYISPCFPFPTITNADIGILAKSDENIRVHLRSEQIPAEVRAILHSKAIMDIEDVVHNWNFPTEIIEKYLYFMDIVVEEGRVHALYVSCEMVITRNWREVCTSAAYLQLLEVEATNGTFVRNLTRCYSCESSYMAMCWDAEEQNLLDDIQRMVNANVAILNFMCNHKQFMDALDAFADAKLERNKQLSARELQEIFISAGFRELPFTADEFMQVW